MSSENFGRSYRLMIEIVCCFQEAPHQVSWLASCLFR